MKTHPFDVSPLFHFLDDIDSRCSVLTSVGGHYILASQSFLCFTFQDRITTMAAVSTSPEIDPTPVTTTNTNSVDVQTKSEAGTEGDDRSGSLKPSAAKVAKKKKWRKPKDKPKRPLSAYNIFFRHERENLLYGNAAVTGPVKIGFSDLAKNIAGKWKRLDQDSRKIYEIQADFEQRRYKAEVEEWRRIQDGGSPAVSSSPLQDADWTVTQAEMADVLSANIRKPSPEEILDHDQSRDALINQLMIAQLMEKYQSSALMNVGMTQIDDCGASMPFMGQQYVDPRMADAELQFKLNYMSAGGESGSALDPFWAASAPRRMSMPTSIEQFAQMQQMQLQAEQFMSGLSGGHGGRRLSMPIGIIDSTHNTTLADRRMLGSLFQEAHQHDQLTQSHNDHQLFEQDYVQSGCNDIFQQGNPGAFVDERGVDGATVGERGSLSTPSTGAAFASTGRRMSMPVSLEQQLLERNSSGLTTMNSPQTRRLSMPMGLSMPTQSQRGEDSLDELTDILKEDVDLFDW